MTLLPTSLRKLKPSKEKVHRFPHHLHLPTTICTHRLDLEGCSCRWATCIPMSSQSLCLCSLPFPHHWLKGIATAPLPTLPHLQYLILHWGIPISMAPNSEENPNTYSGHKAPQNLAPISSLTSSPVSHPLLTLYHTPWPPCSSSSVSKFFLPCLEALLTYLLGFYFTCFKSLLDSHFSGESSLTTLVRTTKSVSPNSVLLILHTLSYVLLLFIYLFFAYHLSYIVSLLIRFIVNCLFLH